MSAAAGRDRNCHIGLAAPITGSPNCPHECKLHILLRALHLPGFLGSLQLDLQTLQVALFVFIILEEKARWILLQLHRIGVVLFGSGKIPGFINPCDWTSSPFYRTRSLKNCVTPIPAVSHIISVA